LSDAILNEPARMELEHVYVAYNNHVILKDLTFEVPHGKRMAVVGPNGAGKSTLFKVLVGLLPLRRGKILVHGLPLGQHIDCVAYVPQREEVDWRFPVTIRDVVMMGRYARMKWLQKPTKEDDDVVQFSLKQMGIDHLACRPIGELSGGQQQRVFLARAIAQEPHIMLLDEPFTGIDASRRFDSVLLLNHHVIAIGPAEKVLTPANLNEAFNNQILYLNGAIMIDQCCPPDDDDHYPKEKP
jgi:manganese/iron transport system ATP-binding protein